MTCKIFTKYAKHTIKTSHYIHESYSNGTTAFLPCALVFVSKTATHSSDTAPRPMSGTQQALKEPKDTGHLDRRWC